MTYKATKNLRFDGWFQMYSDRTNENTGVNRVTQQFIDHGTYVAGPASPTVVGQNAYFGYDIANPGDPVGTYGTFADGTYSTVNTATAHTVTLARTAGLIGPDDTARSKLFQTQLKTTLDLTPDSFIVNRALFSLGRSNKYETYGYDEFVPRDEAIQDRLEYHGIFNLGSVENHLVAGGDFRFSWLISYQDFTSEPFSDYDLSQPASTIFYPGYYLEGKTWGGGASIPGAPGYAANASDPDEGAPTGDQWSYIYDSALFAQDVIKITDKFSITPGFRWDHIAATDSTPPVIEDGYYAYYTYYPLVTPIYIPRGESSPLYVTENGVSHSTYEGYNVSGTKEDQSYFLSLSYKLTDTSSLYATYDRADAILGTSNFGGLDVSATAANFQQALQESLSAVSTLYEVGYKQSFLHNTFFFSLAGFQQTKLGVQIGGAEDKIKDQGIEIDGVYQPSKQWSVNGNFTYQDATTFGNYFFQETGSYLDSYNPDYIVDGKPGTGLGEPNFTGYVPPNGKMRSPASPRSRPISSWSTRRRWAGASASVPRSRAANMPTTRRRSTSRLRRNGTATCSTGAGPGTSASTSRTS